MSQSHSKFRKDEQGITLTLFAMLIVAIFMVVALVVDLGKQQLALTQLQQAADAAALSGARRFNGRPDGWRAAKLAAAMVLRRYPVHGVTPNMREGLRLTDGAAAFWDTRPNPNPSTYAATPPPQVHTGFAGASGGYRVRVERGMYKTKIDNPNETEFVSLEEDSDGEFLTADYHQIANAVRVQVDLDSLPGIFTRLFNTLGFQNLSARAYAASHGEIEVISGPFAIDVEDVFYDTDPRSPSYNHHLAVFSSEAQLGREIRFSILDVRQKKDKLGLSVPPDPDPEGRRTPSAYRREGLARADAFQRKNYAVFDLTEDRPHLPPDRCFGGKLRGTAETCMDIPVEGLMVLQYGVDPTPENFVAALENGVRFKIGDRVTALKRMGSFMTDRSLSTRIAAVINASTITFDEFFIDENGRPLDNYPYSRVTRHTPAGETVKYSGTPQDPQYRPYFGELPPWDSGTSPNAAYDQIVKSPSDSAAEESGVATRQKFGWPDLSAGNPRGMLAWWNPMAHLPEIPLVNNRVLVMRVPLIAPSVTHTPEGREIRYSDHRAMVTGQSPRAVAETDDTKPVVVGFVDVGLFDGNWMALNVLFPTAAIPPPQNPAVGEQTSSPFGIHAPAYLDPSDTDMWESVNTYGTKVEATDKCLDDGNPNCKIPDAPSPPDVPAALPACFDFRGIQKELEDLFNILEDVGEMQISCVPKKADCGVDEDAPCPGCNGGGGGCCSRVTYGTGKPKILADLIRVLTRSWKKPIPANPYTNCVYVLAENGTNTNDLAHYDNLGPKSPGTGWTGGRARFAANSTRVDDMINISSGLPWSRMAPSLVSVNE